MKSKFYPIPILVFYLLFLGSSAKAQCACADGEVPNEINYTVVMPATASSTIISFPKFDPAMGTLTCVVLRDTVTMASTLGIRNLDPDALEYEFLLILGNNISGPGINVSNSGQRPYGPDQLGAYGSATDSISYGPDTLINKAINSRTNSSNIAAYLGNSGTVDINYSTSGGAVSTGGGTNFSQIIRTQSTGIFKLTYFWCPTVILSGKFKDFRIRNADQNTRLSWLIGNDNSTNQYEIQVSNDGINFTTILTAPASVNGRYQFDIDLKPEYKYFRIKQTAADGKINYSAIQRSESGSETAAFRYYPNPATDHINIQNSANLNGDYSVQLFNASGQLLYQKNQAIRANSTISMKLTARPRAGVHYLRIQNNNNPAEAYTVNVIFK